MAQKIRLGIDLDHVIRNINRQILKYYQKDIDESIDIDDADYKDDVLNTICHFETKHDIETFLYEDYPLEIFGHANETERFLSRDLNNWIKELKNQEDYDIDIFFFSMKEFELTIQSSYFFLSKIGSRVRKVIFPENIEELCEYGDVFITSYTDNAKKLSNNGKKIILIDTNFNKNAVKYSDLEYASLREFINDKNKLNKIAEICQSKKKRKWSWTYIKSLILSSIRTKKE